MCADVSKFRELKMVLEQQYLLILLLTFVPSTASPFKIQTNPISHGTIMSRLNKIGDSQSNASWPREQTLMVFMNIFFHTCSLVWALWTKSRPTLTFGLSTARVNSVTGMPSRWHTFCATVQCKAKNGDSRTSRNTHLTDVNWLSKIIFNFPIRRTSGLSTHWCKCWKTGIWIWSYICGLKLILVGESSAMFQLRSIVDLGDLN